MSDKPHIYKLCGWWVVKFKGTIGSAATFSGICCVCREIARAHLITKSHPRIPTFAEMNEYIERRYARGGKGG